MGNIYRTIKEVSEALGQKYEHITNNILVLPVIVAIAHTYDMTFCDASLCVYHRGLGWEICDDEEAKDLAYEIYSAGALEMAIEKYYDDMFYFYDDDEYNDFDIDTYR